MLERIKSLKETLMSQLESQKGNLDCVDAKEMGEVVDMVKDLSEAEYYCTVTKAMTESKDESEMQDKIDRAVMSAQGDRNYYTPYMRYYDMLFDPRYDGRNMNDSRYDGDNRISYDGMDRHGYDSRNYNRGNMVMRDAREGRSPSARRGYMESKENHMDKSYQMEELEKYMQELGTDITEMIKDSTPDEKRILREKLTMLVQKIA